MNLGKNIAVNLAATISILYFMILLPHFGGINITHFQSLWFVAGMAIALIWIPTLLIGRRFTHRSGARYTILCFTPLILEAGFFIALYLAAATDH